MQNTNYNYLKYFGIGFLSYFIDIKFLLVLYSCYTFFNTLTNYYSSQFIFFLSYYFLGLYDTLLYLFMYCFIYIFSHLNYIKNLLNKFYEQFNNFLKFYDEEILLNPNNNSYIIDKIILIKNNILNIKDKIIHIYLLSLNKINSMYFIIKLYKFKDTFFITYLNFINLKINSILLLLNYYLESIPIYLKLKNSLFLIYNYNLQNNVNNIIDLKDKNIITNNPNEENLDLLLENMLKKIPTSKNKNILLKTIPNNLNLNNDSVPILNNNNHIDLQNFFEAISNLSNPTNLSDPNNLSKNFADLNNMNKLLNITNNSNNLNDINSMMNTLNDLQKLTNDMNNFKLPNTNKSKLRKIKRNNLETKK